MEQPTLRLGLLGFSPAQIQSVLSSLGAHTPGWPRWRLSNFQEADAWCVNGAQAQTRQDGQVVVNMMLDHVPQIVLNPTHISRPLAFSTPLPPHVDVADACSPEDGASLRRTLQRFEAWLRPLRAQFALGAEIMARENDLTPGMYHLSSGGRLIAIVDLVKWQVGLLSSARPVDIEECVWERRPSMAHDIPNSFTKMSIAELMWTDAVRTAQDVLPNRYRTHTIYLRRVPNLPVGWLEDEHLVLLRALSVSSMKLSALAHKCEMSPEMTKRALAALYYGGAVTTSRKSAAHTKKERTPVGGESSMPPNILTSSAMSDFLASSPASIRPQPITHDHSDDGTAPVPIVTSSRAYARWPEK
jgi:hypothetical protein